MKVFWGIETSNAQVELSSAANYLAYISDGKPVKKNNLHVTIKYFGDLNSVNVISDLEKAMDRICSKQKSFYLQVDCAANIPGKNMVCALLDGDIHLLESFKADVDKEVARLGYKSRRKKSYMPHVTLAYDTRRNWESEDIRLQKIPFLVSRLTLFESVRQNGETFFIPLYTSDFRG